MDNLLCIVVAETQDIVRGSVGSELDFWDSCKYDPYISFSMSTLFANQRRIPDLPAKRKFPLLRERV